MNEPSVITLLNERGLSKLKSLKLRYRHVQTIKNASRPMRAIHATAKYQTRNGCEFNAYTTAATIPAAAATPVAKRASCGASAKRANSMRRSIGVEINWLRSDLGNL